MSGTCILDGRPAVNVGNQVSVDSTPLELCQECYNKPLLLTLLQFANLRKNAPAPVRQ